MAKTSGKTVAKSAQSIGTVKGLIGAATATDIHGVVRNLQVGDKVNADDVIQTSALGTVHIEFVNASFVTIGHGSTLALDKTVFDPNAAGSAESDIDRMQAMIAAGADPTAVTEAPAAGGEGEQGGHQFIVVRQNAAKAEVTPGFETGAISSVYQASIDGADTDLVANAIPVAQPDAVLTAEDTSLTIQQATLLQNDIDGNNNNLTIISVGANENTHGTVVLNSDGSITYTPDPNYNGVASFTYTVSDGQGGTSTSTVTVTVGSVNDVPVAQADAEGTTENAVLNASVPAATDVDGTIASYQLVSDVSSGTLTFNADGSYSFDPGTAFDDLAVDETRQVSFTYTATDNDGGVSAPQTVTITITGTNDTPVITSSDQTGSVTEDTVLTVTGQVTATDIDTGADLSYSGNSTGMYGSFEVDADTGEWTYTLDNAAHQSLAAGESHNDTFTVTVSDGLGGTTTQDVTITVTGTNDAPVITSSAQLGSVTEDTALTVTGQVTATDVDAGADLAYSGNATGAYGSFTVDADTGEWTYTLDNVAHQNLAADESHNETFTVTVSDGLGGTTTQDVTIIVTGTNDAPVAQASTATAVEDGIAVPVANATDGAALVLTVEITEPNQTFSFNWQFQANDYLPFNDFAFVQIGGQPVATLSNIASVGDYGNSGLQTFSHVFAVPGTYQVVIGVSDAVDTGLDSSLAISNLPTGIITSLNQVGSASGSDGSWTLTSSGANNGTLSNLIGKPFGQLQATDVDAGAVLTFDLNEAAPAGFTLYADGSWTFDPSHAAYQSLAAGESLPIVIPYTVTDEHGATSTSTLTITVTGTNDAPVLSDTINPAAVVELADASAQNLAAITGSFAVSDLDVGNTLDASVVGSPVVLLNGSAFTLPAGALSLIAAGAFTLTDTTSNGGSTTIGYTYDPVAANLDFLGAGQSLTITYTVQVSDGTANSGTQDVTFTIAGANDVPTIGKAEGEVREDDDSDLVGGNLVTGGTVAINEVDAGESGFITQTVTGDYGTFTIDAAGNWTYTADNSQAAIQQLGKDEELKETFTITSADGSATSEVEIEIKGTNDAPVVDSSSITVNEESSNTPLGLDAPTDVDGDTLTITVTGLPTIGTVTLSDGTPVTNGQTLTSAQLTGLQYDAPADYTSGTVGSFTYSVSDGTVTVNGGTMITVGATNDAPTIDVVASTVTENSAVEGTVAATYSTSDEDGDTLVVSFTPGTNGDNYYALDTANNQVVLTEAGADFVNGGGTLPAVNLTVTDNGTPNLSGTDSDTPVITATNDAPILSDTTDPAPVLEDGPGMGQNLDPISGSFPVSDADIGDTLTPSVVGTPVVRLDGNLFTLPPNAGNLIAPNAFTLVGSTSDGGTTSIGYTYDPAAANLNFLQDGQSLTITYTVKVNDGTVDSGTQDVTFTIVGTNDAPHLSVASTDSLVAESGLADGTAPLESATQASGTFTIGDEDGFDDIDSILFNGTSVSFADVLDGYTFTTSNGEVSVSYQSNGVFSYQYTLTDNVDNVNNATASDSFTVQVSDGITTSAPATVTISIEDDKPIANDDYVSAVEGTTAGGTANIMLILDVSYSIVMNNNTDEVRAAVKALAQAYEEAGDFNMVIVTFAPTASIVQAGSETVHVFTSVADVNNWVDGLGSWSGDGLTFATSSQFGTNYNAAVTTAQAAWNSAGIEGASTENSVSYFITDGDPYPSNSALTTANQAAWENYVEAHFNVSYGVGFGGAVNTSSMLGVAHDPDGTSEPIYNVSTESLLQTLLDIAEDTTVGGSMVSGGTSGGTETGNDVLGADGEGALMLVSVAFDKNLDGDFDDPGEKVTFTSTVTEHTFDDLNGAGSVTIKSDGTFSYTAGDDTAHDVTSDITYLIRDGDGSTSSAVLHLTTTDSSEVVAYDNFSQAVVREVEIPGTPTTITLANFSSTSNTSNSGAGYDPWVFDNSGTGISVVDGALDLPANTSILTAANLGDVTKWIASSLSSNTLDVSVNGSGSTGRLLIEDNNDTTSGAAQLLTPSFTVGATGGTTLSFDYQRGNTNGSDTVTWQLYKLTSGTWQAVSGAGYSGTLPNNNTASSVTTGALDADGQYRVYFSVNDGGGGSDSQLYLDNIRLNFTPPPTTAVQVTAATGNVLTDANNFVGSADPWGAVDDKGAEGATLSIWNSDTSSYVTAASGGTTIEGLYGDLVIRSDGSYTYTPDPLNANVGQTETFTYRLTQPDGDSDTASLAIRIGSSAYTGPSTQPTEGSDLLLGDANDNVLSGLGGNDHIEGLGGSDTLHGGDGNDILLGGAGNDILVGGAGNDILIGGQGNDVLTGGLVSDTFKWVASDHTGTTVDTITDFSVAQGDVLDLADLLQGEHSTAGSLGGFLTFTSDGTNTTLTIDVNGPAAGTKGQQIVLQGVDLTSNGTLSNADIIKNLLDNGNLKTDI